MSRHLGFLPGSCGRAHLKSQDVDSFLQLRDLASGGVVGTGRLHFGDLALDEFQFLLRFFGCGHWLTDDAYAAASAQLLDPSDEIAVWKHIIAFRFHHHHEIALAFHVEQDFGVAFALEEE